MCGEFNFLLITPEKIAFVNACSVDKTIGRDRKTTLELTVDIILSLERYVNANDVMQELVDWRPRIPTFVVSL